MDLAKRLPAFLVSDYDTALKELAKRKEQYPKMIHRVKTLDNRIFIESYGLYDYINQIKSDALKQAYLVTK